MNKKLGQKKDVLQTIGRDQDWARLVICSDQLQALHEGDGTALDL